MDISRWKSFKNNAFAYCVMPVYNGYTFQAVKPVHQTVLASNEIVGTKDIKSNYLISTHHQTVLPKDRFFTANSGTKVAVLLQGRSSTAN